MFSPKSLKVAEQLVEPSHLRVAQLSLSAREKKLTELLSTLRLPDEPFSPLDLDLLFGQLAAMDTNNFPDKVGVGQRQGRVFSSFVQQKNSYFSHGIGRSGDVSAPQPKAAGSSLLLKLVQKLSKDALFLAGYQRVQKVLFLPLATGMSIMMALLALSRTRPKARKVIWTRIDQKSVLKCIGSAGLQAVPVQGLVEGDMVITNLQGVQRVLADLGPEQILAVLSTTSCFAPRAPDRVKELSVLAKKYGVFHVINNAYGVQCRQIAKQISEGIEVGQVTAVVQSTDKNFMVPVGSSLIFCKDQAWLKAIAQNYPGRASSTGAVDLLATLLQMGKRQWLALLQQRVNVFKLLKQELALFAASHGERLLQSPANGISVAITLSSLEANKKGVTQLGSLLYSRQVMGHRVVGRKAQAQTLGLRFTNYGSHCEDHPGLPYMTAASAMGMGRQEVNSFIQKLEKSWKEYQE